MSTGTIINAQVWAKLEQPTKHNLTFKNYSSLFLPVDLVQNTPEYDIFVIPLPICTYGTHGYYSDIEVLQ
jgi:hypothetical protein